jgi:hypothetical protein
MINQADVVLLQYPLNLNLSEEARLSSLSRFLSVYLLISNAGCVQRYCILSERH